MTIRPRALLMAAGVGALIQTLFQLINSGSLILQYMAGGNPGSPTEMSGLTQVLGGLLCICGLIADIGAGVLYTYFGARGSALTLGAGTLGGTLSGLAARFVSSLVGSCISVLLIPVFQQRAATGLPPELAGSAADLGAAGGFLGILFSVCLFLIAGGIFGAIGGAVGGATLGKGQAAAAAPVSSL
jgi:hypothetical protein